MSIWALSPVEALKDNLWGSSEASIAGNVCLQMPFAPALLVIGGDASSIVIDTVAPGVVKPHTTACCGARCKTMFDPSVAERNDLRGGADVSDGPSAKKSGGKSAVPSAEKDNSTARSVPATDIGAICDALMPNALQ